MKHCSSFIMLTLRHVMILLLIINNVYPIFSARMIIFILLLVLHLHGNNQMLSHIEQRGIQFLLTWNVKMGLESEHNMLFFLLYTSKEWFFSFTFFCSLTIFRSRWEGELLQFFIFLAGFLFVSFVTCIYTDNGAIMLVACICVSCPWPWHSFI